MHVDEDGANVSSLKEFAKIVFNRPPQDECTIKIIPTMDENENNPSLFSIDDLFQMVLEIWTEGMKVLFGNPETGVVELDSMTYTDAEKVRKYLQSMGLDMYWAKIIENPEDPNGEPITIGEWNPPIVKGDFLVNQIVRLQTNTALYQFCFDLHKPAIQNQR